MKACIEALPHASSIAYFDTSFHRSIPLHIASYAINPEVAQKRGLKKYGFHGLSCASSHTTRKLCAHILTYMLAADAYILDATAHHLERPVSALNLIVMHLGSGASVCAIRNGVSLDTSMGLTPVSGLPGATRCGVIDPSLVFHYTNRAGRITHDPSAAIDVRVTQAEDILNKQSGWCALTGTADFSEIVRRMRDSVGGQELRDWRGEGKWRLAFELFVDRIAGFVGQYYVRLGGRVDALVFSGGIGEKSVELREAVVQSVGCLGFEVDPYANSHVTGKDGVVIDVGKSKNDRKVLVCRTDEQVCLTPVPLSQLNHTHLGDA